MKLIAETAFRGRRERTYVSACIWPRAIKKLPGNGKAGGMATAHTTPEQHKADLEEVRAYMKKHWRASGNDVVMELNFSHGMAGRLMKEIRGESLIKKGNHKE